MRTELMGSQAAPGPSPSRDLTRMAVVVDEMARTVSSLVAREDQLRFAVGRGDVASQSLDTLQGEHRRANVLVDEARTALRAWCAGDADAGLASAAIGDCSKRLDDIVTRCASIG